MAWEVSKRERELFILVIGCGRSGTTYTGDLLRANGIDVKHEELGAQGIIAGDMGARHSLAFSYSMKGKVDIQGAWAKATHVFHQVRSPLPAINSAGIIGHIGSWQFILESLPKIEHEDILIQCMRYWLFWNQMCEANAQWTFRLENIKVLCRRLSDELGRPIVVPPVIPKNANTRRGRAPYYDWTWKDLETADPDLCRRIREKAIAYGYGVTELQHL